MQWKGINVTKETADRQRAAQLLSTALAGGLLLSWPGVLAAQAQEEALADPAPASGEPIVVTGSRVAKAGLDSPAPLTVIDGSTFITQTSRISVGDELTELPQFGPSGTRSASISPTGGNTSTGLNLLDLRNIGSSRTLVLVDGRRHVAAAQGTSQPDISSIPASLIARVEVLTGGASSVYGADALAGVVNFVQRDDFNGLQVNGRMGLSDEGDAKSYLASTTWGTDFAQGAGNVAANFEYAKSERLDYVDRPFSRRQTTLQIPNPANGDRSGVNDGIPDFITVGDLRNANVSAGGVFTNFGAGPNPVFLEFSQNGQLTPVNLGPSGSLIPRVGPLTDGGSGLNTIADETLVPSLERIGGTVIAHYDVSDALRIFAEGKIFQVTSDVASGAPNDSVFIGFDNPFLSSASAATIRGLVPAGSTGFVLNRYLPEIGRRAISNERTTYRGVLGIKGDLGSRTRYELSYSYGRTDADSFFTGNAILPRIALAADAVVDVNGVLGPPGATVCRARLQAGAGGSSNPDIAQCVPGNFLGAGNIDPAVARYINVDTVARGKLEQHVVNGFIGTDSSGLFELPGGPIALVVGGEYRDESTRFTPDPRDLVGDTVNSGIQPVRGSVGVVEGFAELVMPVLANVPGAELLELTASARVAHYDLAGVGTTFSWGVGGVYAPIRSLRLRASYQEAVRAPNLAELFSPATPNVFFTLDPCSFIGIAQGSAQRAANCQALGAPAGGINVFPPSIAPGVQGGNPNLDVEKGRTWTVGGVFTPEFLPGLSVALDYYDIRITNAIFQPNPSTVLTLCVDGPSIDNPFCDAVTRNPTTAIITNINLLFDNVSKLTAKGFDLDARYTIDLGDKSSIALRLLGNYITERDNFLNQLAPNFPTQVLRTVGTPRIRANFNVVYTIDAISLGYTVRYSSSQLRTDPANVRSVAGRPPANPDIFAPEFLSTGDLWIHDAVIQFRAKPNATFYVGVDNLTEPSLPPGIYGGGFGGANYDAVGRTFYAGLTLDF